MSTATTASTSKTAKQAVVSPQITEIQKLAAITKGLLDQYFPSLANIPGVVYVCMSIWQAESAFRIWPSNGVDSRHSTPINPASSTLIGKGYYYTPVIQNLVKSPSTTPTTLLNIDQGKVAHGISGCMGCYHVKGTQDNQDGFGKYSSVTGPLGLEVNPGESITALFTNDDTGKTRSIAAGLIILDGKYQIAARNVSNSPSDNLKQAVGLYVGRAGSVGPLGESYSQRIAQVYGTRTNSQSLLAQAGIVPDASYYTNQGSIYVSAAISSSRNPSTSTSASNQTRVASTNSSPQQVPGCTG